MKGKFTFTAHIEKDSDTGLYIGYIPSLLNEINLSPEDFTDILKKL